MEETITLKEGTEESPVIEITRDILDTTNIPEAIPTKVTELISLPGLENQYKSICEQIELLEERKKTLATQLGEAKELIAKAEVANIDAILAEAEKK